MNNFVASNLGETGGGDRSEQRHGGRRNFRGAGIQVSRRAGPAWVCPAILPFVIHFALSSLVAWADDDPLASPPAKPTNSQTRVAVVGGQPIFESDVSRELRAVTKDREISPNDEPQLRTAVVEHLVKQQLILQRLAREKEFAGDEEVGTAVQKLRGQVERRNQTWDKHLELLQTDEAGLRKLLRWQLNWRRYLDRSLTDENLQRYFEKHRADLDGTEVDVAHILIKVTKEADQKTWEAAREQASQILLEITAGKLTFAEAARKHSSGPTAANGGDLGFISRHEPMPESFSKSAFALHPTEVSPPVKSPFGFHLIQCLEVKRGNKTWQDVRPELERASTVYLFDWLAERQRSVTKVEYLKQD